MLIQPRIFGFTAAPCRDPFPGPSSLPNQPSPDSFRSRVHSLLSFLLFGVPSPFLLVVPLGPTRPARVSSLFAAPPQVSTRRWSTPAPATFRPQVFSTSRRLAPPAASRVYCTPQPRPGFSVQGFLPIRSRPDSSPVRASVPLSPRCSPTCAGCHNESPRLRGLAPRSDAFLEVGV
jgi:hypothetical protein